MAVELRVNPKLSALGIQEKDLGYITDGGMSQERLMRNNFRKVEWQDAYDMDDDTLMFFSNNYEIKLESISVTSRVSHRHIFERFSLNSPMPNIRNIINDKISCGFYHPGVNNSMVGCRLLEGEATAVLLKVLGLSE